MMDPLQLYSAHLDGYQLTRPETMRLSKWIAADPKNADAIVGLSYLHEGIDSRMCLPEMLDELADAEDPELRAEITQSLGQLWDTIEETARVSLDAAPSNTRNTAMWASLAAVAATVVICLTGYALMRPKQPQVGNVPVAAAPSEAAPQQETDATDRASEQPTERPARLVATIEATLDAVWSRDKPPEVGGILIQNEAIELQQGVLQLRTNVGHTLVLQGPVHVKLESAQRAHVLSGKVSGMVGEHSGSLEFVTPTAHVVDLGTEIGVGVDEQQRTLVAVYDGAVEVSSRSQPGGDKLTVLAGYETEVDQDGVLQDSPQRSRHSRAFVRTDEVALMQGAAVGQRDAEAQARFFALLRSETLLAYQSFDAASDGQLHTFGWAEPAMRRYGGRFVATDLTEDPTAGRGSLRMGPSSRAFANLDLSDDSRIADAELLSDDRLVGGPGTEIWVAWRSQATTPAHDSETFAGVSLTVSDESNLFETFVGRIHQIQAIGLQLNQGGDPPIRLKYPIDFDSGTPETQTRDVDSELHQWVVRVVYGESESHVSMWFDTPIADVADQPPAVEQREMVPEFDRIRLALGDDVGQWLFDDLMVAESAEKLAEAAQLLAQPVAQQ